LDEVEVVMMLEDEFVIEIQDEVASTICSPLDAINYITQHPFASADWRDHDEHH
jgi:acyl carrier protein